MLRKHWFSFLLVHAFLVQGLTILLRVGAVYQAVAIGLDALWIGVIGGAFGLLPAVLGLHLGRYIDRSGETTALVGGSIAMLASSLCLTLLPPTLASILLGSIIMGAGQFLCIAAQQSSASKGGGPSRAKNIGRFTLAVAVAQAVGPLGVSAFSGDDLVPDTQALFELCTVLCAICMLCALLVRHPPHALTVASRSILETGKTLFRISNFQLATYSSVVLFSAMDLLIVYLPLYGAEQGISSGTVGVLLAIRGGAGILSRFFFPWMLRLIGNNRLLLYSLSGSGIAIAVLALTTNPIAMGVALFVAGFGLGLGAPLSLAWLADIVPAEIRGSALSVRLALNRFSQTTIPIAAGFIIAPLGLAGVLLTVSASLLVTAAVSRRKLAMKR